jgi:hypothetical protein
VPAAPRLGPATWLLLPAPSPLRLEFRRQSRHPSQRDGAETLVHTERLFLTIRYKWRFDPSMSYFKILIQPKMVEYCLSWHRRDVHLHVVLLQPGDGDPLALVKLAQKRIAEGERKSESLYVHRAVLIDADRLGQSPLRDAQIAPIAHAAHIQVIWQRPCHEALL